jgi:hypothetical protein
VVSKTHNLQKPTKWGLCIDVIADPTNGYNCGHIPILWIKILKSLMHPELTITIRTILEPMSKTQNITNGKGYHLYTDKFYTNLDLAGRAETLFYCDTCPKKPGLHPNKRLAIYHIKLRNTFRYNVTE